MWQMDKKRPKEVIASEIIMDYKSYFDVKLNPLDLGIEETTQMVVWLKVWRSELFLLF